MLNKILAFIAVLAFCLVAAPMAQAASSIELGGGVYCNNDIGGTGDVFSAVGIGGYGGSATNTGWTNVGMESDIFTSLSAYNGYSATQGQNYVSVTAKEGRRDVEATSQTQVNLSAITHNGTAIITGDAAAMAQAARWGH